MPRRKITIEDAFARLEAAGIQVQVKSVSVDEQAEQPIIKKKDMTVYGPPVPTAIGKSTTKVALYARHSIGSGGVTVETVDGKQIEHAGVESYGPGICYVPTYLAAQLLHQDALARHADERMLDRQQRCYVVAPKIGGDGQRANVAVQVDEDTLANIGNLPAHMMHLIR